MRRKMMTGTQTFGVYGLWLLMSGLLGVLAWQLHVTTLYLFALWLSSDLPLPTGWTTNSLAGINKLSILLFVSLWIVGAMLLEGDLRRSVWRQSLLRRASTVLVAMALLFGAAYGIPFVVG